MKNEEKSIDEGNSEDKEVEQAFSLLDTYNEKFCDI